MKAKFLRIGSSLGILALLISGNFLLFPKASRASSVCSESMSNSSASASSVPSGTQGERMKVQMKLDRYQARKNFLECRLNNEPLSKQGRRSIQRDLAKVNRWIDYLNKELAKP
jgi:hypothetical protein